MSEFYDHKELLANKYVDVRVSTTDRHTDETASDGADDILNMEDDGELGLDDGEEEQGDSKETPTVTFFDMVSDSCKERMNDIKITSY